MLATLVAAVVPLRPATAQDSKVADLTAAFRASLEGPPDLASISRRVRDLSKVVDADGWKRDLDEIASILDEVAKSTKPDAAEKQVTRLFDKVAFYRRKGRPERMLPALQALQVLRADDARVLFATGEAFGVASDVFDAERSRTAFQQCSRLLETKASSAKSPRERAGELVKFLPELSGETDAAQWLRNRILDWVDVLERGQPIGLWKLRDDRMEGLRHSLIVERRRGKQKEMARVLAAILGVHQDDPGAHYMLGELHASLGPEFSPPKSMKSFERFLELTEGSRFERHVDEESPRMSRDDVAKSVRELMNVDAHDVLDSMRQNADMLLRNMREQGDKFKPRLTYPDLVKLAEDHEKLVKEIAGHEADIAAMEGQVRDAERERERLRSERDRKMRETKKGFFDPEPYNDRISRHGATIKRNEPKIAEQQKKLADKQERLPAMESALRQAEQDAEAVSSRRSR